MENSRKAGARKKHASLHTINLSPPVTPWKAQREDKGKRGERGSDTVRSGNSAAFIFLLHRSGAHNHHSTTKQHTTSFKQVSFTKCCTELYDTQKGTINHLELAGTAGSINNTNKHIHRQKYILSNNGIRSKRLRAAWKGEVSTKGESAVRTQKRVRGRQNASKWLAENPRGDSLPRPRAYRRRERGHRAPLSRSPRCRASAHIPDPVYIHPVCMAGGRL